MSKDPYIGKVCVCRQFKFGLVKCKRGDTWHGVNVHNGRPWQSKYPRLAREEHSIVTLHR